MEGTHRSSQTCKSVVFFKKMNFLNCCLQSQLTGQQLSQNPQNKLKRILISGGLQGSGEKGCMLDSRLLFGHCSITLLFLPLPEPKPSPSLTEVFAYAASPASLCATSTCRLRHQRSMSVSASGHPKMVLPPIDSEGDTFKAM